MSGSGAVEEDEGRGRVLVVDDQRNMRLTTAMVLRSEGYAVLEAESGAAALDLLARQPIELVLTDLKMTPMDGLTLLRRAVEVAPKAQVIVMTAFGSIESAVEAMRAGAYDYVTKPFQEGELVHRVEAAVERAKLRRAADYFAQDFNQRYGVSALIGATPVMRELSARILKVASSDATILIQGESGTGKELVARALHAHSRRRAQPFVAINCAAITETLLETELFGHAKGAFTGAVKARRGLFEEANGGTLFVDEISETTLASQSKLLRTLQEGEVRRVGESSPVKVDVRIIAATNRDLEREVVEKRFRQDLYYRLRVVDIRVPPLRDRLDDVGELATHFLSRLNERAERPRRLTPEALRHLRTYDYPGNVRELENLVEQAAALSEREELTASDFPFTRHFPSATATTLADAIAEAERRAIRAALEKSHGDLGAVAERLRISSTTLWRKMRRLGIGQES